jgi:lipooligosaccharide transport system permease protein
MAASLFGLEKNGGHLYPRSSGRPADLYVRAGIGSRQPVAANGRHFLSGVPRCWHSVLQHHEQRTWEAILNTPVTLDDIVLSEILWAASKSLLSGLAVLIVIWAMGLSHSLLSLWLIPLSLLVGLCFAALGLIMTALAPSYSFFMYYFTLAITPMMFLSGVFFPVTQLPWLLQSISSVLPLSHAVDIARPLMNGILPAEMWLHVMVLLGYTVFGFYVSLVLFRRRLSQ